jgi:crossover junction endodeoxyribonuclease RuvC
MMHELLLHPIIYLFEEVFVWKKTSFFFCWHGKFVILWIHMFATADRPTALTFRCDSVSYIEERTRLRILGIDPGIAIVGFGFIDKKGSKLTPVQYGCIRTEAHTEPSVRLRQIYDSLLQLIDTYRPDEVALEKLFFNRNVTTALTVGQARGVLMLAAEQKGLPMGEYTPLQVKQAIVGYGKAEKTQVQEMVRMFLHLKEAPKPDDVADALAIAICHAHSSGLRQKISEVYGK